MKTKEKENTEQAESSNEQTEDKEFSSQLFEKVWSVVNFESCVASSLTYDEAVKKMNKLAKENASGLCIITDEAAARIGKM